MAGYQNLQSSQADVERDFSFSEIERVTTFCGSLLLNFTLYPSKERQSLVAVGDIERLSKQKGSLHMDFTFMTRKFSFLCLTEKVEYSFLKADELVEGQRGFTWCISLSERKDHHAIDFILTTIKTQVLMATGDDFSPSRIVIDFDQGTFPLSLSKYSPKIKLASVLAIEEVLPKTEIEYCYVHLYRAVKDKAMELFQGIDLEN